MVLAHTDPLRYVPRRPQKHQNNPLTHRTPLNPGQNRRHRSHRLANVGFRHNDGSHNGPSRALLRRRIFIPHLRSISRPGHPHQPRPGIPTQHHHHQLTSLMPTNNSCLILYISILSPPYLAYKLYESCCGNNL